MHKSVLFLSILITVPILASCAESLSKEEAIRRAKGVCVQMDWPCERFEAENRITEYVLTTPVTASKKQVEIIIDKRSGEVKNKSFKQVLP